MDNHETWSDEDRSLEQVDPLDDDEERQVVYKAINSFQCVKTPDDNI